MNEDTKWKWIKTYNLILRLMYYEDKKESILINKLNEDYNKFLNNKKLNPNNEEIKFIEADFLLTLAFMLVVRVKEFIDNELTEEDAKKIFDFNLWKKAGFSNFNDLKQGYNITLKALETGEKKPSESKKLRGIFGRLRNSISHFNYVDEDEDLLRFFNINDKGNIVFDCYISKKDFLNLSVLFGQLVNEIVFHYHK
jgi:hypothetical protein